MDRGGKCKKRDFAQRKTKENKETEHKMKYLITLFRDRLNGLDVLKNG